MNAARRMRAGAVAVLAMATVGGVAGPVLAASGAKSSASTDPITMGSVQIVNALSSVGPITISVDGRVRARGVPTMATTSPMAVGAGTHRIQVASTLNVANTTEAAGTAPTPTRVAGDATLLTLDLSPGARRTAFIAGTIGAPWLVVVDTPTDATRVAKTRQIVDLRPAAGRSVVRVGGVPRTVNSDGLSSVFVVASDASFDVEGSAALSQRPINAAEGPTLLFVVGTGGQTSLGTVRQNLSGIDSLRSPTPIVLHSRPSLSRFFASIALVVAATGGAISSMVVFRGRTRDDRVRGLMAKSFGL